MLDTPFASWLLPEVAAEHDDMNREYFEKGTVGTYPYFYLLREAIELVVQDASQMTCLDVGCGAGWQAKYLDMVGLLQRLTYEGVDISPHMCDRASRNCPMGRFHVSDIFDFNPERKWDIVMACGSIEHLSEWQIFLAKLAQLSSEWIIVHKMFLTENGAPTNVEQRQMYRGLAEIRVHMNFHEFSDALDTCDFEIVKKYDWSGVYSIVARRKHA
jgi:trans-aconitate methyltransferase